MSHKPVTVKITGSGGASVDQQESVKTGRKFFKTLQYTATDKENLAGRPMRTLKDSLSKEDVQTLLELKRKKAIRKKSPSTDEKITEDDLTNVAGPSENYWQVLAEKRRVALEEALDENEKLCKMIEELTEKNALMERMLDEANSFVEVFKEMVNDNDTGIDVKDVSSADDTVDTSTIVAAADDSTVSNSAADDSTIDNSAADDSTLDNSAADDSTVNNSITGVTSDTAYIKDSAAEHKDTKE